MKSVLSIFLCGLLSLSAMSFSPRANALIAGSTLNVGLFYTGAVVFVAATLNPADRMGLTNKQEMHIAFAMALAGIFILDNDNGKQLQFKEIQSSDLKKLKITATQADVFNSELDEVQALSQSMAKTLINKYGQKTVDSKSLALEVDNMWANHYKSGKILAGTFEAIKAIRYQQ